jgi:beta-galactosidase
LSSDITADRRSAIAMAASLALASVTSGGQAQPSRVKRSIQAVGRDMPFDDGWRFHRGAVESFEGPSLNDAQWRVVDLPHDWSIEDIPGGQAPKQLGPFSKNAKGGTATGFTEGGEGWYRKHFRTAGFPADARVELLFDGVYGESEIWLNGHPLGRNVHGYIPFAVDLTPHLVRDGDNVLAVRVRNLGENSRWYSGSGLYRQVKLDVLPAGARIARWGVGAWTRRIENGAADIDVTTRIEATAAGLELVTRLRDIHGAIVAEAVSAATAELKQALALRAPHLWSPDSPYLYTLESELRRGGTTIDRMTQPFGVRIVTFVPQRGMAINGTVAKLRGGCIHHDNGLLGARAFADADERRVRLLKARGFNAIRSSHNPASRSLREACDRLGMLLIEEAFDAWHVAKKPDDFSRHFAEHWEEAIRAMVLSARNSPSVILWSIGNEIPQRATDIGVEWAWKLANAVKRLDPTRPVTAAIHGTIGPPMIASEATARPGFAGRKDNASTIFLDVPGFNYRLENIEPEHGEHPERIVYASETFPRDAFDYQALAERAPYFLGEFVWTAMDYLGEAGIGATTFLKKGGMPFYLAGWPWVNAWCGDIDLIGHQKPPSLARDVAWGLSPLEMMVQRPVPDDTFEYISNWGWTDELPNWTWPGAEGKSLAVRLYTSGDRVDLLLNGRLVGTKALAAGDKGKAEFMVPYAPGTLEAIAWQAGKRIGGRKLETVSAPARLRVTPERGTVGKDRQALNFVAIDVLDGNGRVVPEEVRKIRLAIDGPAELVAFGSANPQATGSFQSPEAQSFRGRAMAILRSRGQAGLVRVTARSEGLPAASAAVRLV